MKHAILCGILFTASACGSSSHHGATGDAGPDGAITATSAGGGTGAGGAPGAGGSTGDGAITCPTLNLNSAPLACSQNWTAAQAEYPHTCSVAVGGYQGRCGPDDTIVFNDATTESWCFYSPTTGNLTGFRSTTSGASTCGVFDFNVTLPETATCSPMSRTACGPDSGLTP